MSVIQKTVPIPRDSVAPLKALGAELARDDDAERIRGYIDALVALAGPSLLEGERAKLVDAGQDFARIWNNPARAWDVADALRLMAVAFDGAWNDRFRRPAVCRAVVSQMGLCASRAMLYALHHAAKIRFQKAKADGTANVPGDCSCHTVSDN